MHVEYVHKYFSVILIAKRMSPKLLILNICDPYSLRNFPRVKFKETKELPCRYIMEYKKNIGNTVSAEFLNDIIHNTRVVDWWEAAFTTSQARGLSAPKKGDNLRDHFQSYVVYDESRQKHTSKIIQLNRLDPSYQYKVIAFCAKLLKPWKLLKARNSEEN